MRGLISITQGRYQLRQHSKEVDDLSGPFERTQIRKRAIWLMEFSLMIGVFQRRQHKSFTTVPFRGGLVGFELG